jgi:hypothetical protein
MWFSFAPPKRHGSWQEWCVWGGVVLSESLHALSKRHVRLQHVVLLVPSEKNKDKGKNGVCEVDWLFKTPLHFFENYEHQRYMLRASLYPRGRQTATMFQVGWRERNVSAQLYRRVSKIANENYMWLSGWFLKINMQQVDFSKAQCSTRMVRFLCIFAWQP